MTANKHDPISAPRQSRIRGQMVTLPARMGRVLLLRPLILLTVIFVLWWAVVLITAAPPYILPSPERVLWALLHQRGLIFPAMLVTASEILMGLVLGLGAACVAAIMLVRWDGARRWLLPLLVMSQALPVFALAPMLILWLGYGVASKVAMAMLIIFFPIMTGFYDGLRRTDPALLDVGRVMLAGTKRGHWSLIRYLRIPAALPSLASGLRIGVAVAPIGAVVGEWVGAGAGLGHLMLLSNGRMQIDLMFACLLTLTLMALFFYVVVDQLLNRFFWWSPERSNARHSS